MVVGSFDAWLSRPACFEARAFDGNIATPNPQTASSHEPTRYSSSAFLMSVCSTQMTGAPDDAAEINAAGPRLSLLSAQLRGSQPKSTGGDTFSLHIRDGERQSILLGRANSEPELQQASTEGLWSGPERDVLSSPLDFSMVAFMPSSSTDHHLYGSSNRHPSSSLGPFLSPSASPVRPQLGGKGIDTADHSESPGAQRCSPIDAGFPFVVSDAWSPSCSPSCRRLCGHHSGGSVGGSAGEDGSCDGSRGALAAVAGDRTLDEVSTASLRLAPHAPPEVAGVRTTLWRNAYDGTVRGGRPRIVAGAGGLSPGAGCGGRWRVAQSSSHSVQHQEEETQLSGVPAADPELFASGRPRSLADMLQNALRRA